MLFVMDERFSECVFDDTKWGQGVLNTSVLTVIGIRGDNVGIFP